MIGTSFLFLPPALSFFSALSAFLSFPLSLAAPASAGGSTLNRYLHFGHSTLVPTRSGLLMSTGASQLGHGTLKLDMERSRGAVRVRRA